jgi:hypothetical protein
LCDTISSLDEQYYEKEPLKNGGQKCMSEIMKTSLMLKKSETA